VANQVAVKVRKHGSAQKFNARVLAVGHEVRGVWALLLTAHIDNTDSTHRQHFQIVGSMVHSSQPAQHLLFKQHSKLTPFGSCSIVCHYCFLVPSSCSATLHTTCEDWHALSFCWLQCDIAMLTVDDDEFWEDVQPLEINGLPAMQESVMVVGFPTG
jgi:hypothetical protein